MPTHPASSESKISTDHQESKSSRRRFIRDTSAVAATSTFVASSIPKVHAAESHEIRIAIVGCGGRGTGAVQNAITDANGPIKLHAMADVFENKLTSSYGTLKEKLGDKIDVPEERRFYEFDGYKQAMDTLRPGDVVILSTPPAFRWVHFTYAIEKGLNVFMEKPVTIDGPGSRRMLELAAKSVAKNLKVGVGLMCRHCEARADLLKRIKEGEIGDITFLRAYRMAGPTGSAVVPPMPKEWTSSELMYQISKFHGFLWLSGGGFSDFLIHNVDECCWMKGDWPVEAKATGGRHYRNDNVDQNFDSYSVEYTFDDGTKLYLNGRTVPGCHHEFASYAHGTKGSAVISTSGHSPAKCRIYNSHKMDPKNVTWKCQAKEPKPYDLEWEHLIQAIREDKPYNEVERGVKASVVTSMGRMAAHTGQIVTYDDMLNCQHEFAPGLDQMNRESKPPVIADANGKYPIPQPGILVDREY